MELPAIPWVHEAADFGSVWIWETPHFIVTVNGDTRSFYYTIGDKTSPAADGHPRMLTDGQASTFEQAERGIRGTIGKSYPPNIGYAYYAGSLATTFTIATGQNIDLGVYAGQTITVTTLNPDGTRTDYTGTASIQHYDLILTMGTSAIRISPSYIAAIKPMGKIVPTTAQGKVNRTMKGRVVPGCTGTPGFMGGTVDHTGRICPIHEENIR